MRIEDFDSGYQPIRRGTGSAHATDDLAPATRAAASTIARPDIGDQIGRFRLLREIFRGENSSIYEVVERGTGRSWALKLLAPEFAAYHELRTQFRLEAELANRVEHASILPVIDCERDGGFVFTIARLESGDTLSSLSVKSADKHEESFFVELARKFCGVVEAVARLHDVGVVHRDIEPANILVGDDGCFVLCDFGSAIDRDSGGKCFDGWMGTTVRYRSPEQMLPGSDPLDPAGDVYALGLTLHQLLTGRYPFAGCCEENLARTIITRRVPRARRVHPDIPMGLDAIVRQATEENVAMRYDSAQEMADDLSRFVLRRRGSHRRL